MQLTTPENTISYHMHMHMHRFQFSWGHFNSQEKLKIMLMQNFGVTNKEHYGMLWYFWSDQLACRTGVIASPNYFDIGGSGGRLWGSESQLNLKPLT